MNRETFFKRGFNRIKGKRFGNAHAYKEFGCSATPAPTPPGSERVTRKAGVGAGLYNNQVGAGVKMEEVKIKGESQNQSQRQHQHRGKPPLVSLAGRAGFSTPFPRWVDPEGSFIFSVYSGGRHDGTAEGATAGFRIKTILCRITKWPRWPGYRSIRSAIGGS